MLGFNLVNFWNFIEKKAPSGATEDIIQVGELMSQLILMFKTSKVCSVRPLFGYSTQYFYSSKGFQYASTTVYYLLSSF